MFIQNCYKTVTPLYFCLAETLWVQGIGLSSCTEPETDSPANNPSNFSSVLDSARFMEDEDDVDRSKFEKMMNNRVDLPTSENGIYLARTVAPVLTKALAEVLLRRPADPIGFISEWLQKYHSDLPRRNGKY